MPVLLAALALAAGPAPAAPTAPTPVVASYCSRSGDLCFGIRRKQGAIFLDIDTFERYFTRYRLCVLGPTGKPACRSFPIRRRARLYGSSVRWNTNFPRLGPGLYRVTWKLGAQRLGPTLRFRVRPA